MAVETFRSALTRVSRAFSHPLAFVVAAVFGAYVLMTAPEERTWHFGLTLATLFMTLFIQRTAHRDMLAVHAKLDELLRADARARTEFASLDDDEPEAIVRHRDAAQKSAQAELRRTGTG